MTLKIHTRNITTTLTTRRPTLIRVWRTDGARLTSTWHATLALPTTSISPPTPRLEPTHPAEPPPTAVRLLFHPDAPPRLHPGFAP